MALTRDTSIQYLKGVGEKRAALYSRLGIQSVGDLLYHFPRSYIDLSRPYNVQSAPVEEAVAVRAILTAKSREQRIRKGLSLFHLTAEDETCELRVTMFNAAYTIQQLVVGREYIFFGKVGGTLLRREMSAPSIFPADSKFSILPVYAQTAGLTSATIRRQMAQVLEELKTLPDPLPPALRERRGFEPVLPSLQSVHFPQHLSQAETARDRFVYEELLVLSCALLGMRDKRQQQTVTPLTPVDLEPFYRSLPFRPTQAQLRSIDEAVKDLCSSTPMNRLIQGDVGSGKTLVAAACVYFAVQNGAQAAMMAPTGILSEQHLETMSQFLQPFGIRVALLTGATKSKEKKEILSGLADGSIQFCVGTHALLSEGVEYHNLGLVITDEQHRFGVAQRARLSQKGADCHVLVMSATPIPRTLSLIVYGDLQLSVIDELPPGRKPVETLVIGSSKRERALGFLRKAVDEERQAYIVCPLVEEGEIDTGLRPAVQYAEFLSQNELKGYRVGLLHGRMKPREKEETMRRFKEGELQVLVSTTVVEVGVDVPNATIIMIENAERFGLSQLHQLRGRVGRGDAQSWCILVSDAKGETARRRLKAMKDISDGFKLAEYDLELRGPGDFFGERQHGLPDLQVASFAGNMDIMHRAQGDAEKLLQEDPCLSNEDNLPLRKAVDRMLYRVGTRPN